MPQGVEWLYLLGIGISAQLGQIQITQGFALETASRASSVTYVQIVLAYTWGVLLFGEYPNPRTYGCFPLVLAEFVWAEKHLRLPEAIRKMTSFPAQRLGLPDRGLLKDGYRADVVVFNPLHKLALRWIPRWWTWRR